MSVHLYMAYRSMFHMNYTPILVVIKRNNMKLPKIEINENEIIEMQESMVLHQRAVMQR